MSGEESRSPDRDHKRRTLCKVCGDRSSGKHYGVLTCDGCRGFFKRSVRRGLNYNCKNFGDCVVDVTRRNQCQACRLKKCFQVEMNPDAVQHERAPRSLSKSNSSGRFTVSMKTLSSKTKRRNAKIKREKEEQSSDESSLPSSPRSPGLGELNDFSNSGHHQADDLKNFENKELTLRNGSSDKGYKSVEEVNDEADKKCKKYTTKKCMSNNNNVNTGDHEDNQSLDVGDYSEYFDHYDNDTSNKKRNNNNSYNNTNINNYDNNPNKNNNNNNNNNNTTTTTNSTTTTTTNNNMGYMGYGDEQNSQPNVWPQLAVPANNPIALYESAIQLLYMSVSWARHIPMFMDLPFRDQAILLEEGWSELFLLNAVQFSLPVDITTLFAAAGLTVSQASSAKVMAEIRVLQNVVARFHQLHINSVEYACLKAVVLFKSDLRGLRAPHDIEKLQDQAQTMLNEYCQSHVTSSDQARFGKLLLTLPSLRSVDPKTIEQLFFRGAGEAISIERMLCDMFKAC